MNNLVIFLLDKKLWTSRFLTSPVHSGDFEKILVLTSSHYAQKYILRYRIDISDGNNYSHLLLILLTK